MNGGSTPRLADRMELFDRSRAELGALVLIQVERSIGAFWAADTDAALEVADADRSVDAQCRAIEDEILGIRRRWSPQLRDLRILHAGLIVAVALERVGNLAVAIAGRTQAGSEPDRYPEALRSMLRAMSDQAVDAIADAVGAYASGAVEDLESQARRWDLVTQGLREILGVASGPLAEADGRAEGVADAVLVARHLERLANNAFEASRRMDWVQAGVRVA